MASFQQDLIFTVLPFGVFKDQSGDLFLDFSLLVSPRLDADVSTAHLSDYPDWAVTRTWPDTVNAFLPTIELHVNGVPGPPLPVTRVGPHAPDATRFGNLLPGGTTVTPYVFQGYDNRKIRSAPVGHLVDALQAAYARFGFNSPATFPEYKDLVDVSAFGPMGFQQNNPPRIAGGAAGIPGSGEQRKTKLNQALEQTLITDKAVPYDLSTIAASTGIDGAATSLAFLQHQRFLQRGLGTSDTLTTRPPVPVWDFHQRVAGLQSLPTLLRVLGLVLDLRAGPIDAAILNGTYHPVSVSIDPTKFNPLVPTNLVLPATQAYLAKGVFKPAPKDPTHTDHVDRMLKVGVPALYRAVRVEHDGAAVKAVQFANNVTRSRNGASKLTASTPDRYALPALRTGGFAIARNGRATLMVATLARQTNLQDGYFPQSGSPKPKTLYEEDLIRGYRLDVLDVADGKWRSLMWRQGPVTVAGTDPLFVREEDTVVPAPTTADRPDPPDPNADLYLQETLTRWDGWSLAVPRLGTPFPSTAAGTSDFNLTAEWHVPGSSRSGDEEQTTLNELRLPRLRFGRTYQLRARAADLAGNALLPAAAPHSTLVETPPLRHLRFEPLVAPRAVLLRSGLWAHPPAPMADTPVLRPGDSEEVVVIRSESATVDAKTTLDNGTSMRLLLPAQTSVTMAEHHHAFDDAIAGKPMEQALAVYNAIAGRDAASIHDAASLLDGTAPNSTANPYLFPDLLPIDYLPDVPGRVALVRHLPSNAVKQTTAELPFDTAKKGWPQLRAVRVKLSRGQTDWTTTVVPDATDPSRTTELDLTLAKGVMVTTLVNSGIDKLTVSIMAIWEWIEEYAKAHNESTTEVLHQILAGEHWMFTPWRKVTFIHAVRTPLKDPVLLIKPAKTAIGQTYAAFVGTKTDPKSGTILFSRRSTARVDVDATWAMPVDTGSNDDPVTPQDFRAPAFDIEPARAGFGWVKDPNGNSIQNVDAQNVDTRHEFHDTKFRAVTYRGTATSFYVEYFRQHFDLPFTIASLQLAREPGVAFEASTVQLTVRSDNKPPRRLVPAPPGTDPSAPAPTPGDYLVVEDPNLNGANPDAATHGTIQLLANAAVSQDQTLVNPVVEFAYVGPTIHTFSDPAADKTVHMHVLNSARPKAPHVRYVVPIYQRTLTRGGIARTGGALRVYLERPWWSSGDEERLGVVCWHRGASTAKLPPDALAPYVTQWGYDPVFRSTTDVPDQPTPACFPFATSSRSDGALSIEEAGSKVDVAGHDVGFDIDRGLWYCDIRVTDPRGNSLTTYTPFIRMALARYQPFSIHDAHLSRVVLVDYAQLAPDRHLTVTGSGLKRAVAITGRAARATSSDTRASKMLLLIEEKDARVTDDALGWNLASGPTGFQDTVTMTASAASSKSDFVTWTAEVQLPDGNSKPLRLTFEEYERIDGGTGDSAGMGRLAWTESIVVQSPN